MNRTLTFAALGFALALSAPAFAGGNVEAGQKAAAPCAACHGVDGNPAADAPQYPRLAGQYRDYLEQALKEYRDGKRKNPIMAGFTQVKNADGEFTMTDQAIADLALYFASLPGKLGDVHDNVQGN
ncbi:MAG: cytochrome c [Tahibacter sp.]